MTGWWACTIKALPFVAPVAHAAPAAVARHAIRRGVGHGFRKHLVRHWGVSHAAAVTTWRAGVTCVWVAGVAAAGRAAWDVGAPAGWGVGAPWPDAGAAAPDVVMTVPEPSSIAVFSLAVGALALIRWRR